MALFNLESAIAAPRPTETVGTKVISRPSIAEVRRALGKDADLTKIVGQIRIVEKLTDNPRRLDALKRLEESTALKVSEAQDALDFATLDTPEETAALESLADWTTLYNLIVKYETHVQAEIDEALNKGKKKEKDIDYTDPWNSWARNNGWLLEGEDPKDHLVIEKMERFFFKWLMENVVKRFWKDPNNNTQQGYLKFLAWPIQAGENPLTLDNIIDQFPGDQNHLRDLINLISHIISGGVGWHEIAKLNGPHDKVHEHISHSMFSGKEWGELAHMPAMEGEKKTLGDLTFEGLKYYTHWNEWFVLPAPAETKAMGADLDAKIDRDPEFMFPSGKLIQAAFERANKNPSDLVKFNIKGVTDESVIFIYGLSDPDSEVENHAARYAKFRLNLRNHILREQINALSAGRQRQFGIFPLLDVGEQNFGTDAFGNDHATKRDVWRTQIAIAIGCYNLELGEYDVMKNKVVSEGVERDLTEEEKKKAFEAGKPGELLAFHTYQSNLGSTNDDNATFLATTKPTRLRYTKFYRLRYPGQEGVWNKYQFGSLLPDPFQYMAVEGKCLRSMFLDREKRKHARYETMPDSQKKNFVEIYGFAMTIYEILARGLQRGLKGFHFDKLGQFVKESQFSTDEELSIAKEAIDALTDFWRSTLGYWLDPRLLITEAEMATGFYDPDFWQKIPGTNIRTPIFAKQMFHPSDGDKEKMIAAIVARGGKKSDARAVLQKAMMASFTLESLMLLESEKLSVAEEAAVTYAFSGQSEYPIKQGQPGDQAVPGYGFTRAEIVGILRLAKVVRHGLGFALLSALQASSRY